jgi:hypothetical protein
VFCKKSPQTIENKEREVEKEGEEIPRVRKGLLGRELGGFSTPRYPDPAGAGADNRVGNQMHPLDTRAFCIDVKGKGLRKKGFVSVWK